MMKNYFFQIIVATILVLTIAPVNASIESDFTSGLEYFNNGNYPQAREIFQKVITHFENSSDIEHPRYVLARFYRGRCNEELGDLKPALSDFLYVDKRNLPTHEVWRNVVDVYVKISEQKSGIEFLKAKLKNSYRFEYLFELGRLYWMIEDRTNAVEMFKNASLLLPNDSQTLFYLSYLYWEVEDYHNAGQTADIMVKIVEDPVLKVYCDGMIWFSVGLYEKAADNFKSALSVEPDDPTMQALLLDSYLKAGEFIEADKLVKKMISDDSNAWNWFKASEIPLYKLDYPNARVLYDSMDSKLQEQPSGVLLNAFVLANTDKIAEAETLLESHRDREFTKPEYYPALVALKFKLGKSNEISPIVKKFSENISGDFPVDSSLFWLIMFEGHDEVLFELTDLAEMLGAKNPKIAGVNAIIDFLSRVGDLNTAKIRNDELIIENPDNAQFLLRATVLSYRLSDINGARDYWIKFKAIPDRDSTYDYIVDRIDKLLE